MIARALVIVSLLALSGCMSVSGFERAVDTWKVIDQRVYSAANKALDKEGKPTVAPAWQSCSEFNVIDDRQAYCNCAYPMATDPDSSTFAICMGLSQ